MSYSDEPGLYGGRQCEFGKEDWGTWVFLPGCPVQINSSDPRILDYLIFLPERRPMSYSDEPSPMYDRAEELPPSRSWLVLVVIALCLGAVVMVDLALR